MSIDEVLGAARDAITMRRVFGDPIDREGMTLIPVARVGGGGGSPGHPERPGGAGFGLGATPVGMYVVRDGQLSWQPAFDLNRAVLGGQVVAVVALLTVRSIVRRRRRRRLVRVTSGPPAERVTAARPTGRG